MSNHYYEMKISELENKVAVKDAEIESLKAERERRRELYRMQLAGIMTISMCNTPASLSANMVSEDSPYWTMSLRDVEDAMKREIKLITENKKLRECVEWFRQMDYDGEYGMSRATECLEELESNE